MKFSIQRANLIKSLSVVSNIASGNKSNAIYNNVLINLSESGLELTCIDLNLEIKSSIDKNMIIEFDTYFKFTVSAKYLLEICKLELSSNKNSADDIILFDYDGDKESVTIKRNKNKYVLNTLLSDSFPESTDISVDYKLSITEQNLKEIFKTTSFAMANNDVRVFLNGLNFNLKGDMLNVVATDSHSLALNQFKLLSGESSALDFSVIIHRRTVSELLKLIDSNSSEDIQVEIGRNNICFSNKYFKFISKLIESDYPQYMKLFIRDSSKKGQFVVKREELKQLINSINFIDSDAASNNWIKMQLSNNRLSFNKNSSLHDQASVYTDQIVYDGPDVELVFNSQYLTNILNNISNESLNVSFSDTQIDVSTPESANTFNLKYIIMLVKQ